MRIEIIKTFEDLGTVFQAGEIKNLPTSLCERYISLNVANKSDYKSYVERLANEPTSKPPVGPDVFDWGTRTLANGNVQIFRRQVCSGETSFFKEPPSGCPADVVKHFLAMAQPGTSQETYAAWQERTQREQAEQDAREKKGLAHFRLRFSGLSHLMEK